MRLNGARLTSRGGAAGGRARPQHQPAGHSLAPRNRPAALLSLQRLAGNRATWRLIQPARDNRVRGMNTVATISSHEAGPETALPRHTGDGRPLDQATRSFMEARFGADFGPVRIHTDRDAAQAADRLHALAYTSGRDIFFAAGRYQPGQPAGRQLLAHELTHVMQQAGARGSVKPGLGSRGDSAEHQARQVATRLAEGASHVGDLGPVSPSGIQRAEPEPSGETPREPAELPPVDVVSPEVLALAERAAAEIDDAVTPNWEKVRNGTAYDALVMASQVEKILYDTFEVGHGVGQQLRESDAPVLQYLVGQYPNLRTRLVILRDRAGERNTVRIGKYLGIQMAETKRFTYEIHMIQAEVGKKVFTAMEAAVKIRYVENGKPVWTAGYEFLGGGVGVGAAPGGQSEDVGWNAFSTPEYWEPGNFPGTMDITGAGGMAGGGWESEFATLYGSGERVPITIDVGGQIVGSPDIGASIVKGRLWLLSVPRNVPPPSPPPAPSGLAQPIPVHDQMTVFFATNKANLNSEQLRKLAVFVERNLELFADGDYELQVIGNASRLGDPDDNVTLSKNRINEVLTVTNALLKGRDISLDGERVRPFALGERQALAALKPDDDDSAEDRTVEIALNGTIHREIPTP